MSRAKHWGKGFVNHALDEYRHTEFFRRLLKSSNNTELRFDPRLAIALGFINPEKFLFEANDLTQFTAFVAVNEASALRMFSKIKPAIAGETEELKNEIEDIIDDETDHLRSFTENPEENIKYSDTFVYEMLLLDEERHASLSDGFLGKNCFPKKKKMVETSV